MLNQRFSLVLKPKKAKSRQPNTIEYPGSLLRASQIEVHYRSRDILCLEQLTIQEGTYRFALEPANYHLCDKWYSRVTATAAAQG